MPLSVPAHAAARSALPLLMICIALAGCHGAQQGGFMMPPAVVSYVTLKTSAVPLKRELPGRVSARVVAEVRPQVGGIVKQVLFTEGGQVRAGQELYQLDDAVYRATARSAEAAAQRAQAQLEIARRAAQRGADLMKAKMISVQDNDNLQSALHSAEADATASAAAWDSARINVGYAHIRAPISGRIGKSAVTQGALVVANQPDALALVQQIDTVYVDLSQSSNEWLQLQQELSAGGKGEAGRDVRITLEDGSPYPETGHLQFADVTVDKDTGSFLLRVLVPNPKHLLRPGMYVRAEINEGVLESGLLVPQQGITHDPKGQATAMVVGADGKAEVRTLTTLRTVGDQWLVGSGLAAGDRVIVEGLQSVQPGMTVQASERGAAPSGAPPAPGANATGNAAVAPAAGK